MNTILKKHTIALIVLIIALLAGAAGVLYLFYSMNGKVAQVVAVKERIASYQKNKKAFADEAQKLKVLDGRVDTLESSIVTSEQVPQLLSQFETLALASGTSFEITSVQTPIENEKTKLVVEFNTKGSYAQIDSFLKKLEHQAFQIKITQLFLLGSVEEKVEATSGTLPAGTKQPVVQKAPTWQAVATVEILSF